jgi:hypothetical protein
MSRRRFCLGVKQMILPGPGSFGIFGVMQRSKPTDWERQFDRLQHVA